jgi:hypothetical protein
MRNGGGVCFVVGGVCGALARLRVGSRSLLVLLDRSWHVERRRLALSLHCDGKLFWIVIEYGSICLQVQGWLVLYEGGLLCLAHVDGVVCGCVCCAALHR